MDSIGGQTSCDVVFADTEEAGPLWEASVMAAHDQPATHNQPSVGQGVVGLDREPEGAASPEAGEHSVEELTRSPARLAAQDADALLLPDLEKAASQRPSLADAGTFPNDVLPADADVSCKASWPATAVAKHQRETRLPEQRVMTGQEGTVADSIVFADEDADLGGSAGSLACQASGAARSQDPTHVAVPGGRTMGVYRPDIGWADEAAGDAPGSASGVASLEATEQHMDDDHEGALGIVFADSQEQDTWPASPVDFGDQPGNDGGQHGPRS